MSVLKPEHRAAIKTRFASELRGTSATDIRELILHGVGWTLRIDYSPREALAEAKEIAKGLPRLSRPIVIPPPDRATSVPESPAAWSGEKVWGRIHTLALAWNGDRFAHAFTIGLIVAGLPCGECNDDARRWVVANPPDYSSAAALFGWSVGWHNSVNAKLGKPAMSIEDARQRWQTE